MDFTNTNRPPGFYVYAYVRPEPDGRPCYIGKGIGGRAWAPHGSPKKRWQPPSNEQIKILEWDMPEAKAHELEIGLIAIHGRTPAGYLTLNFTDGGEGLSGYEYTEELHEFQAAEVDHVARISKAAATRVAKNAAELGMTVEEYNALPYWKRSKLRKERQGAA